MSLPRPRSLALALAAATLAVSCSTSPHASAPSASAAPEPSTVVSVPSTAPARSSTPPDPMPTDPGTPDARPNILLITSDDQTLSDMAWMPRTNRLLGAAGITFSHMLSPHPLCCPARAEILTGQYAQNNGVRSNKNDLLGGFHRLDNTQTIATWLSDAGYQTAFVGKYLNEYEAEDGFQPGWDIWNPTIKNVYGYFNYTMFNNGHPKAYADLHNADLVGMKTADYIERLAKSDKPFFIWSSHVAPHGACLPNQELTCWSPPLPAKRHANLFSETQSPSLADPAYNEKDVSDKPLEIQHLAFRNTRHINELFRQRIRSLQAVDEAVARDIRALREAGELDNTVVAFTTDNGYLLGEHRYAFKNVPYEQALRVPLLVRGPGLDTDAVREQTVTTVDLAPTFLDVAGALPTLDVDGRSLWPIARGADVPGHETVLIQSGPRNAGEVDFGWAYRGVRTDRYTYAYYPRADFTELYDRRLDPAQLTNVASDPAYVVILADLQQRAELLGSCAGTSCQQTFGALPRPARIPVAGR